MPAPMPSYLVDYADDIDPAWLDGVTTVGVTSGASVPEVLVRGVLERLAEYGYGTVQPVTTANETLVFALPREIRPPALTVGSRRVSTGHRQMSYSQASGRRVARAARAAPVLDAGVLVVAAAIAHPRHRMVRRVARTRTVGRGGLIRFVRRVVGHAVPCVPDGRRGRGARSARHAHDARRSERSARIGRSDRCARIGRSPRSGAARRSAGGGLRRSRASSLLGRRRRGSAEGSTGGPAGRGRRGRACTASMISVSGGRAWRERDVAAGRGLRGGRGASSSSTGRRGWGARSSAADRVATDRPRPSDLDDSFEATVANAAAAAPSARGGLLGGVLLGRLVSAEPSSPGTTAPCRSTARSPR